MAGFKHLTRENVEVQVDVSTRVDAALQVGNVTESVIVTTEAPPLQTDSASLGTVISQQEVESIPLSGRNVNNMLTLVPGVVAQGGTYGNAVSNQSGGARTNAIGFGNYAIGGGFGNQSSFYIDGVASNAPAGNLNSLIPSQDAVQEFRVVTNNVAAEYGNYAGGIINLTTKSGTNAFHGTAYEYLRNKVLNANDYFSNQAGLARVPLIQNQFGGTIGGPIRKDKTFFFFGYEYEKLKTGTLVTSTVPTTAELGGDFTAPGLPVINFNATECSTKSARIGLTPPPWRFLRSPIPPRTGPACYRTTSLFRRLPEASTSNTTRVSITVCPKRTACLLVIRIGRQTATPMMPGGR
jgi:hypothetical protein